MKNTSFPYFYPLVLPQSLPDEAWVMRLAKRVRAYVSLMKPTLQLLVVLTGAAALVAQGTLLAEPARFGLALLFLALSAGSAKALNQYLERRADQTTRTRYRRPLPLGLISPGEALTFALVLGLIAVLGFAFYFNILAALLSAATILFYSLFYTLYLKPRTPYSIVIGGIAGGMGPVISWAAAGEAMYPLPFLMLAVIFFWTPAHFWALALNYQEDFRRVGYPMLPITAGETKTWQAIFRYALLTVFVSLSLIVVGSGGIYLVAALGLGGLFLFRILPGMKRPNAQAAQRTFMDSILYLLLLFSIYLLDKLLV